VIRWPSFDDTGEQKMYTTLLGVAMYFGFGGASAPAAWHTDYAKAHAEACASDKPLFIVICPGSSDYARMMALGTFLNDQIEESLRTGYVRSCIDTETPEGQELARKFDTDQGPHFVIIDRSGKWQVFYRSGILLDRDLAPVLTKYRRAKLTATGTPIVETKTKVIRTTVQLCST
jgi:hypothetical protein